MVKDAFQKRDMTEVLAMAHSIATSTISISRDAMQNAIFPSTHLHLAQTETDLSDEALAKTDDSLCNTSADDSSPEKTERKRPSLSKPILRLPQLMDSFLDADTDMFDPNSVLTHEVLSPVPALDE